MEIKKSSLYKNNISGFLLSNTFLIDGERALLVVGLRTMNSFTVFRSAITLFIISNNKELVHVSVVQRAKDFVAA